MPAGISPGGRPIDTSPLGKKPLWHKKGLHLPPYIRGVARGINPADPEAAIDEAVAAIKRWAATSKNPAVKAAAIKALAEWEAAKGGDLSNSGRLDIALATAIVAQQDGPRMTSAANFGGKKAKPFGKKGKAVRDAAKDKLRANKAAEKRESLNFTRQDAKDLCLAVLSTKARKKLPKKDFAVPGGKYPIPDEAHARNALSRVAQFGTPEEKAQVRAAVRKKFPAIGGDVKLSWDAFDAARGTKPKTAKTPPPATGNIEGYQGPAQSQNAIDTIKAFQKANGLPVTGNLDAATYNAAKNAPAKVVAAAAAKKGASAAKAAANKAKAAANKDAAAKKKAANAAASQAKKDAAAKAKKDKAIAAAKATIESASRTPAQNAAAAKAAKLAAAHALLAANGG